MALYKNPNYFRHTDDNAFDLEHRPGAATPYSGIYQCAGCGREITSVTGHTLPPQNHHQHTYGQGAIRWRLIVADQARP